MPGQPSFLDLLYSGASEDAFDGVVAALEADGADPGEIAAARRQRDHALRLRERMRRWQRREGELTALYDTANDLIGIRDVDRILTAIVQRARQLLGADITYLSLNDEDEGASYMRVTDGSVSAEFRNLRLPLGTGLLGLVAQRGAPYYTADYRHDQRFVHRDYIEHAVDDEGIRAILGVPLTVDGTVIGALLAGHRSVRPFPPDEVTLLSSFAAHAAVALQNARLFQQTRDALADLDEANRRIREQARAVELAGEAHDRLTGVLLRGGGADAVAEALAEVLAGSVSVYDAEDRLVAQAGAPGPPAEALADAFAESRASGRVVATTVAGRPVQVAAGVAGAEHLGAVVLHGRVAPLSDGERRTVERGAIVTALVQLFARSVADAEERVRGELLSDLLGGREADRALLRERARRHHVDLDTLAVVAVGQVAAEGRHRAALSAARLGRERGGIGGEVDGLVVLVGPAAEGTDLGRLLHDRLGAAVDAPATVGVATGEDLVQAYADARSCVRTLVALGRAGQVADPGQLGVAGLLLGHNGAGDLAGFLDHTLGPVLAYDRARQTDLVPTLAAWFASGGRLREAASTLHIHPNTVTQRLDRIGQLLGDWRSPDRSLELQVALQLWRVRDGA